MKQTYINPEIEVVKIAALKMLSGSPEVNDQDASKDGNGDYNPSRGYDFDFDFDEEY